MSASTEMLGQTITVLLDGNKTADLQVEEFHPYEPSAYCWSPGWTCYDLNTDTEYFVDETGSVWVQPENRVAGVCPVIAEEAARIEAEMERAHERRMS